MEELPQPSPPPEPQAVPHLWHRVKEQDNHAQVRGRKVGHTTKTMVPAISISLEEGSESGAPRSERSCHSVCNMHECVCAPVPTAGERSCPLPNQCIIIHILFLFCCCSPT